MSNASIAPVRSDLDPFDAFSASLDALLVVAFPKSNSRNFPIALGVAQGASKFGHFTVNGQPLYVAVFQKSAADAGRAVVLMNYVASWKGVLIFVKGRLQLSTYTVAAVIDCYLNASSCSNPVAYCHKIIDDPAVPRAFRGGMSLTISMSAVPKRQKLVHIDRYAFPCKHLFPYFRIESDHTSTVRDQIEAAGVQYGCQMCPNFNPDAYVKVGQRSELQDELD